MMELFNVRHCDVIESDCTALLHKRCSFISLKSESALHLHSKYTSPIHVNVQIYN